MKAFISTAIIGFNYLVAFYYGMINSVYTVLLSLALVVVLAHIQRIRYSAVREFRFSPETPPVSVLIPAYNESGVIVQAVTGALQLDYPSFELIVINDGSRDDTLEKLIDTFGLKRIDLAYRSLLKTKPVRGFYYSPERPNLLVIDKENGGKADALNCGINAAKSPYFASVDADSVLERDALIRLMAPISQSTLPVVACGGVVRVLNGTVVKDGIVQEIALPRDTLSMFQIVEYLRAFLFGRVGWDAVNGLLIVSGTFSLFSKAAVMAVGGYDTRNVTEDMELIVRLQRHYLTRRERYIIRFISDPICWSEAPESLKMLARQRRRWHLGLIQSIMKHRVMLFNPAFGRMGLFVAPYYLLFEVFGPVIEVFGYAAVLLALGLSLLSFEFFALYVLLAIFYGVFLSIIGVFLEEITYRRYPTWEHLFRLLTYALIENFGYRQLNSLWRFEATFLYIFGRRRWEVVEGKGRYLSRPR
ncbi:MAG: glycosyltransferase family 2 protein [Candidatus Rokubacteria bacterium]|nr:glycosyltransferase family 2 protein [Candidatus Rokubacteria bacterium]